QDVASTALLGAEVLQGLSDTLTLAYAALVQEGAATRETEEVITDMSRLLEDSPNGLLMLIQRIRQAALRTRDLIQALHLNQSSQEESVDRKSTRLNSSHEWISYAVFCLKKKQHKQEPAQTRR